MDPATKYHTRIRDSLDRYGERPSRPRAKRFKAIDKSGWKQQELNLTTTIKGAKNDDQNRVEN